MTNVNFLLTISIEKVVITSNYNRRVNFEEILLFFTVRCLYHEFFFHRVTIGSLRNDHGERNENGKKQ